MNCPRCRFAPPLGAALAYRSPGRCLAGFVPAAAVVAAAFFVTNNWAHGDWLPPYAHRGDGPQSGCRRTATIWPRSKPARSRRRCANELSKSGIELSAQATLQPRWSGQGWMIWDPGRAGSAGGVGRRAVRAGFRVGPVVRVRRQLLAGRAQDGRGSGRAVAAGVRVPCVVRAPRHVLADADLAAQSGRRRALAPARGKPACAGVAAGILLVTLVCLAFYLARPLADRNYGGVACGFPLDVLVCPAVAAGDDPRGRRDRRAARLALRRPGLAADQCDFRRLCFAESLVPSVAVRVLEFFGLDPVSWQARSRFWFWFRLLVVAGVVRGGWLAANAASLRSDPDTYRQLARNLLADGTFGYRVAATRPRATSAAADGLSPAVVPVGAGGRRLG